MRLLVIGGSDAGIAAALRARELDPAVEATLVVAERLPQLLHLRAAPPGRGSLTGRGWRPCCRPPSTGLL
jgi:hypothetical protein